MAVADPAAATAPATDLESRLTALEQKLEVLWSDRAAEALQQRAQMASAPENGTYRCSECGTQITAIHPDRWYTGYGPIECPNHPGRPELMISLDRLAETKTVAPALAPGPQPALPAGTNFGADVPPPPPHVATVPPVPEPPATPAPAAPAEAPVATPPEEVTF
jgi:DNA-directed RNA polymerase subunit RPC12/RpoP